MIIKNDKIVNNVKTMNHNNIIESELLMYLFKIFINKIVI